MKELESASWKHLATIRTTTGYYSSLVGFAEILAKEKRYQAFCDDLPHIYFIFSIMTAIPELTRGMFSPKAKFYVVDNFYPEVWDEGQLWLIGPNGKYVAGVQERPMTMDVGTFELTWEQFCGQVEETWAEIYD